MVYDVTAPQSAEETAAALGVPGHDRRPEQLIGADDVDAVAICSSTDTHVDLLVAGAAAGKPIFCEKPLSLDLAEVDGALAAIAARPACSLQVGFNRRFDPSHRLGARRGSPAATSASSTSCASPAATRRRRPSPTSRCPAGSSAT